MLVKNRALLVGTVFVFATGITACSFSNSSGSFSESSESFSKSSNSISDSASSSSDGTSESVEETSRFQDEVTDFTVVFVESNVSDMATFKRSLSEIAAQEDIINWEQNRDTYIGIGRGLKKASISKNSYETFKKNFAEGDYQKMQDIQKGFDLE